MAAMEHTTTRPRRRMAPLALTLIAWLVVRGESRAQSVVWRQQPVSGPLPSERAAMVFDSGRGVVVLFGGYPSAELAATWEWNGTMWTQRASGGPVRRFGHAMAYDAARGVTVLFGGLS